MGDLLFEYKAKNGDILSFDMSQTICKPFGFYYSDRVMTPKGPASVVGIREGCMWFHIDGDTGASFWDTGKSYQDLQKLPITLIEPQPILVDLTEKNGVYKLKRITFKERNLHIILQNENGPCPLIAIGNVLALRGDIMIDSGDPGDIHKSVDIEYIKNLLTDLLVLRNASKGDDVAAQVQKAINQLPNLQTGMDVNFGFSQPDSFEKTDQSRIFELLGVRLMHGWMVDPIDSETCVVIANNTYNDLMNKLVALDNPTTSPSTPSQPSQTSQTISQPSSQPSSQTPPTPLSPTASPSSPVQSNPPDNEQKKDEPPKQPTPQDYHEGEIISSFLHQTSSQLTAHGLNVLRDSLQEGEFCVFFRNNHFSTLTKHDNQLYILVTDIGYEKERNIIWDLLNSVDGSSLLATGDFVPADDEKKEEITKTLELMGFPKNKIEEGLKSTPREKLVNPDDAISYLAQMFQQQPRQVV